MIKIIFILHNIYESVNGVSTKYLKFINFLSNMSYDIILFTTFKNKITYNDIISKNTNIKIIKTKGLTIPFYKEVKIPIINENQLKKEIKTGNEIIIFNGEFILLYDIFKKIKIKNKNIKIYPTMHTNYVYYMENFYGNYNFSSVLNNLNDYLVKKYFTGIIVTGQKMEEKYLRFTDVVFNANEVNLNIFKHIKKDDYNINFYNIIYTGRISKEKNIEEIFECCMEINDEYNFTLNIIGNGPDVDYLKNIIDDKYNKLKHKIEFHGNKEQHEINSIYQSLNNRIFLFTSMSETFGKTPMEAGATGIPIFIKKSEITDYLYVNKKNAFIFDDKGSFKYLFEYFINLNTLEKHLFINNSINNIIKYDQDIIFNDWLQFLIYNKLNKNNYTKNIFLFDSFSLFGLTKLINCSASIFAE